MNKGTPDKNYRRQRRERENGNNAEDPRGKDISTLLQKKKCFPKLMNELKMKGEVSENQLEVEQVVYKAMHTGWRHVEKKWRG